MGNRQKADTTESLGEGLGEFTVELMNDLKALRSGDITPREARVRALLAREILRAVHLQMEGMKYLAENAKAVKALGVK